MAKGAKKKTDEVEETVNICRNRRATHEYEILDAVECGLVLVGTEVKSLRAATRTSKTPTPGSTTARCG